MTSVSESSEIGRFGDEPVHISREREVNQREYDVPRTSEGDIPTSDRVHILILCSGITGHHQFGHTKHSSKDSMPSPNADEDTNQLQRELIHSVVVRCSRLIQLASRNARADSPP